MTTKRKVMLTPVQARAVEALRRCDANAVRYSVELIIDDAALSAHAARNGGCKATARKQFARDAAAQRAIARVVRALMSTPGAAP